MLQYAFAIIKSNVQTVHLRYAANVGLGEAFLRTDENNNE